MVRTAWSLGQPRVFVRADATRPNPSKRQHGVRRLGRVQVGKRDPSGTVTPLTPLTPLNGQRSVAFLTLRPGLFRDWGESGFRNLRKPGVVAGVGPALATCSRSVLGANALFRKGFQVTKRMTKTTYQSIPIHVRAFCSCCAIAARCQRAGFANSLRWGRLDTSAMPKRKSCAQVPSRVRSCFTESCCWLSVAHSGALHLAKEDFATNCRRKAPSALRAELEE